MHSSAFSRHCVQESDSSRLCCKHLPVQLWSNAAAIWHPYGKSHYACLSAAYASTVCLCSRVRNFSKKWCERVRPYYSPEGAASTFGIYLGYCMYFAWRNSLVLQCGSNLLSCALAAYVRDPRLEYVCFPNCHWPWYRSRSWHGSSNRWTTLNHQEGSSAENGVWIFERPSTFVKHNCVPRKSNIYCEYSICIVYIYEAEPARYAARLLTQVPSMVSTRCRCPRCLM